MIDGYKYEDGVVKIVEYDNANIRTTKERDYQDNIEELLMAENILEHLQEAKDFYSSMRGHYDAEGTDRTEKILACVIMGIVVTIIGGGICSVFIGPMGFVILGLCSIAAFGSIAYFEVKKMDKLFQRIDGVENVLQEIEEKLEENKIIRRRLENDNRRERIQKVNALSSEYKQLGYVEELRKLDEYLSLCYDAGAYEDDFSLYEKRGILDGQLVDGYGEEGAKTMKKIMSSRNKRKTQKEKLG